MEREVGGRLKREGTDVYLWLIHVDVWQESSQYCKIIILQLKIKKFKKICSVIHTMSDIQTSSDSHARLHTRTLAIWNTTQPLKRMK